MFVRGALFATILFSLACTAGALWLSSDDADLLPVPRRAAAATTKSSEPTEWSLPDLPRPRAVVDHRRHEFGVMCVGQEYKHVYKIQNAGNAPLRIVERSTTCKCTLSRLSRGELPPGEFAEVELAWTPTEPADEARQVALLETNDPALPQIRIEAAGRVVPAFSVNPDGSWQLGDLVEGKTTEVAGTIVSAARDHFEIHEIVPSSPLLSASVTPLGREELEHLGARSGYTVHAALAPGLSVGRFQQTLTLHTDLTDGEPIVLVLEGEVPGPIRFLGSRWSAEERMFHLGNFPASEGRKAILSVFIRPFAEGTKPVLTPAGTDVDCLKVSVRRDPSFTGTRQERFEVTIEVPAGSPLTSRIPQTPAHIEFETNVPGQERLTLPVSFVAF